MFHAVLMLALAWTNLHMAEGFNVDIGHPVVWHGNSPNFGYKMVIDKHHNGSYRIVVAAPGGLPTEHENICKGSHCYVCLEEEAPTCNFSPGLNVTEFTFNKEHRFPLSDNSNKRTKVVMKPTNHGFEVEVYFDGERIHNVTVNRTLKEERPGNIYDRAYCTADLNDDGAQDLVLGSPLYSHRGYQEVGEVLVYFNGGELEKVHGRLTEEKAHFGANVACVGDIDNDGFQDVAVGAPGSGFGKGAVYVLYGERNRTAYRPRTQRVVPIIQNNATVNFSGLGSYVTGGMDLDNNGFRDVAVGASKSRHVLLLWSRPVVRVLPSFKSQVDLVTNTTRIFNISYSLSIEPYKKLAPLDVSRLNFSADMHVWVQSDGPLCVVGTSSWCADQENGRLLSREVTAHSGEPFHINLTLALKRGVPILPGEIRLKLNFIMIKPSTERHEDGECDGENSGEDGEGGSYNGENDKDGNEAGEDCGEYDEDDDETDENGNENDEYGPGDGDNGDENGFCKSCAIIDPKNDTTQLISSIRHNISCDNRLCRTDLKLDAQLLGNTTHILPTEQRAIRIYAKAQSLGDTAHLTTFRVLATAWLRGVLVDVFWQVEMDAGEQMNAYTEVNIGQITALADQVKLNVSVWCLGEEQTPADNYKVFSLGILPRSEGGTLSLPPDMAPGCPVAGLTSGDNSSADVWIIAVWVVGAIVLYTLLQLAAIAVMRTVRSSKGQKTEEILKMTDNAEPFYEYPETVQPYSTQNDLYESSEPSDIRRENTS